MCAICNGTGWVCGCCLDKPWEGPGSCQCGESGKNCECNQSGSLGLGSIVIASTDNNELTTIH